MNWNCGEHTMHTQDLDHDVIYCDKIFNVLRLRGVYISSRKWRDISWHIINGQTTTDLFRPIKISIGSIGFHHKLNNNFVPEIDCAWNLSAPMDRASHFHHLACESSRKVKIISDSHETVRQSNAHKSINARKECKYVRSIVSNDWWNREIGIRWKCDSISLGRGQKIERFFSINQINKISIMMMMIDVVKWDSIHLFCALFGFFFVINCFR